MQNKQWNLAENPPIESGNYWCYLITPGVKTGFQTNVFYNSKDKIWHLNHYEEVTHWTTLMPVPN